MPDILWISVTPLGEEIRLSHDGWYRKIIISHPEFATGAGYSDEVRGVLQDPEYIVEGWASESLTLRRCQSAPGGEKYLCVVYRPGKSAGFVITAFFVSRYDKLLRRKIRWQKPN